MKTEKKPEEKVCIKDCLIINKREVCEIFDLNTELSDEDLEKKTSPLNFVPPGDQDDYVYLYLTGISISRQIDIVGLKYDMSFYAGTFGPLISIAELSRSEINKKGFKLIKLSSMESLEEENINGWRKANAREALEIFLILILQSPTTKEYQKILNILNKYFVEGGGYHHLCNAFLEGNLVGIRITNLVQIELFEQEKNKIGREIMNLRVKMNSIWIHE